MTDPDKNLLITLVIIAAILGGLAGSYSQSFSIPTCKIWESNRTYDHILIADDVICKDIENATYYHYDTVRYDGIEYLLQKQQVKNGTSREIIVCRDRSVN